MLKNSLEERDSWVCLRRKSKRERESQPILTEGNRWEMSRDKRNHVGRCHQLEGKKPEFDQSTRIYLLDSWALWEIQKNVELFWEQ
jgi:hypothetical protein